MRKILFWLHLCAGVLAGVVVFIMSVTGVLLMYEKQTISWFDAKSLPAINSTSRLPVEVLLNRARDDRGALPSAITLFSAASTPAQLAFGRDVAYQDPSTGVILGGGDVAVRQFFRGVTDWHRWLGASAEDRAAGRAVTGASNLAFLFLVLSGLYLWLPRVWTAASVRAISLFRGGLSGKARDFNWHNTIGIWSLIPLALIVTSATVISYPWASNLVYSLSGSPAPAAPAERKGEGPPNARREKGAAKGAESTGKQARSTPPNGPGGAPPMDLDLSGVDALWARAANHLPEWRTVSLRLPASHRAPAVFTIDRGYAGQPQLRATLTLDWQSGEVKSAESFEDFNRGRQIRTWLRFVHTGEFYGLPGQTVAGVASLGAAVLVFTGVSLSLRRFSAWRARKRRVEARASVEDQPVS